MSDNNYGEKLRHGIAAYSHEQKVLLRLIRKSGELTETKFDELFNGREHRKPGKLCGTGISGDSILLGIGINGFNEWAWWLELLQCLVSLKEVNTCMVDGKVIYSLPQNPEQPK